MVFPGDPKGYPLRDEVVQYLETYAAEFKLPFQGGTRVLEVVQKDKAFEVRCDNGAAFTARAVVLASGEFSRPYMPSIPGLEISKGSVCKARRIERPMPLLASMLSWSGQRTRLFKLSTSLPALHR